MSAKIQQVNEGQIWLYQTRPNDKNSYLIIRKIDEDKQTIHLTIMNIDMNGEIWNIDHIPIHVNWLLKDLIKQAEVNDGFEDVDSNDFKDAYELWKSDKGGVWNVPLKEVVELTLKSINS